MEGLTTVSYGQNARERKKKKKETKKTGAYQRRAIRKSLGERSPCADSSKLINGAGKTFGRPGKKGKLAPPSFKKPGVIGSAITAQIRLMARVMVKPDSGANHFGKNRRPRPQGFCARCQSVPTPTPESCTRGKLPRPRIRIVSSELYFGEGDAST